MAESRRGFLSTGGVWSGDVAARSLSAAGHSSSSLGEGSSRALPALPDTPQHDFIFWPENVCGCVTARSVPVTNTPGNAPPVLPKPFAGTALVHHLVPPTSFAANAINGLGGSIFSPTERAEVRREGGSEQPNRGVPPRGWRCEPCSDGVQAVPSSAAAFGHPRRSMFKRETARAKPRSELAWRHRQTDSSP